MIRNHVGDRRLIGFIRTDTLDQAVSKVDSSWKGVYRVGGVCLFVSGVIFLLVAVFSMIIGAAPGSGQEYLLALSSNVQVAKLNFGLYAISDVLFIPVALALYLSLKQVNKNAMLIAAGLMVMYSIFDLAVTELNSLDAVLLSQQYVHASTEAQQAAYLAAAYFALSTIPIATFFTYLVSSVGLVIASLVSFRGVFNKITALLGITAGIEGTIGAFYVFFPGLAALLTPALIAYGAWGLFAGVRLFKLGRGHAQPAATPG
jgi:hypothetical protein